MKPFFTGLLLLLISFTINAQVTVLKDIVTKPASVTNPGYDRLDMVKAGAFNYFYINRQGNVEVWQTDGSAAGTKRFPVDHTIGVPFGNQYAYSVKGKLFLTDGSSLGTEIINTNADTEDEGEISKMQELDGELIFIVKRYISLTEELWKSDGTTEGTSLITTLPILQNAYIDTHPGNINGYWYFKRIGYGSGPSSNTTEIWRTDGTEAGTTIVKIFNDIVFTLIAPVGPNAMMFTQEAATQATKLWVTDGTLAGTSEFIAINGFVNKFIPYNNQLVVVQASWIYITDGTEVGTTLLSNPTYIERIGIMNNKIYALIHDNQGCSILESNGTVVGTTTDALSDCLTGEDLTDLYRTDRKFVVFKDHFLASYYTAETGYELGWSDGTAEGTILIKDIMPGSKSSRPADFTVLEGGNKAIFLADDGVHGRELWITDGTSEGTTMVKDVRYGTDDSMEYYFTLFLKNNDYLYFWATNNTEDNIYKKSLWRTDGTTEGTTRNYDFSLDAGFIGVNNGKILLVNQYQGQILALDGLTNPAPVLKEVENTGTGYYGALGVENKINDINLFPLTTPGEGSEYWVTDGTESGTHILKDINDGPLGGFNGSPPVVFNNKMYFGADDGDGFELWVTDGTAENTTKLKDINPNGASNPNNFVKTATHVYFIADDGTHGGELWKSDGTAEGTVMVKDTAPGIVVDKVFPLATTDDKVFFLQYDGLVPHLWITDGTEENTIELYTNEMATLRAGGYHHDKFFFSITTPEDGTWLWTSDGTEEGTAALSEIEGPLTNFKALEGFVYFATKGKMYRSAGFEGSTEFIADIEPKAMTYFNEHVFFQGYTEEYGMEIYKIPYTKLEQDLTFDVINAKTMGDAAFEIHAEASSEITFTSNDKVSLDGSTVTILKPGLASITATAGDKTFESVEETREFCVNPAKPTITLNNANTEELTLVSSAEDGNQWYKDEVAIDGATNKNLVITEVGDYSVKSTVDACASAASDILTIIVTGLENFESLMKLYPNPVSKELSIEWNGSEKVGLEIMNIHGQKMYEAQFHSRHKIDLAQWSTDLYIVKLQVNDKVMWKKFVKQ